MEGLRSQAESQNNNNGNFDELSQQDRKLLIRILRDDKASITLRKMVRDILRRYGITGRNEADVKEEDFAALDNVATVPTCSVPNEHQFQFNMLGSVNCHMPMATASEMINQSLPAHGVEFVTPHYYPQYPMPYTQSMDFFRQISLDILVFIFYHYEGTYAQRMAAEVLKENNWSFHRKYLMWFRRVKKPDVLAPDFEMGTYFYFDIEQWEVRIMEGFVFEYKYLVNS